MNNNIQKNTEISRLQAELVMQKDKLNEKETQHQQAGKLKKIGLFVVFGLPFIVGLLERVRTQIAPRFGEGVLPVIGVIAIIVILAGIAAVIIGIVKERQHNQHIEALQGNMRARRRNIRKLQEQ